MGDLKEVQKEQKIVVTEAMVDEACGYIRCFYGEVELETLVEQALLAVLSKTELLSHHQKAWCVQSIFLYPH